MVYSNSPLMSPITWPVIVGILLHISAPSPDIFRFAFLFARSPLRFPVEGHIVRAHVFSITVQTYNTPRVCQTVLRTTSQILDNSAILFV